MDMPAATETASLVHRMFRQATSGDRALVVHDIVAAFLEFATAAR